jgi:hypothetical protein
MRRPLLALLVIPVAASAFLLFGSSRHPGMLARDSNAAVATEQPAAMAHAELPSAPGGNAAKLAEGTPDPAAASITNEADLRQYLDRIEGEARTRNEVRPEDFKRGGAAIARRVDVLGRDRASVLARQFGVRLHTLSRAIERKPITDELDTLATALEAEKDATARQKLFVRYKVVANQLPQLDRLEAMGRMERVAKQL